MNSIEINTTSINAIIQDFLHDATWQLALKAMYSIQSKARVSNLQYKGKPNRRP